MKTLLWSSLRILQAPCVPAAGEPLARSRLSVCLPIRDQAATVSRGTTPLAAAPGSKGGDAKTRMQHATRSGQAGVPDIHRACARSNRTPPPPATSLPNSESRTSRNQAEALGCNGPEGPPCFPSTFAPLARDLQLPRLARPLQEVVALVRPSRSICRRWATY